MAKTKIKVGGYYELKLRNGEKTAFAVMYGFDTGKNKDIYALMFYKNGKCFEFPIHKNLFKKWVENNQVKEITSEELLSLM